MKPITANHIITIYLMHSSIFLANNIWGFCDHVSGHGMLCLIYDDTTVGLACFIKILGDFSLSVNSPRLTSMFLKIYAKLTSTCGAEGPVMHDAFRAQSRSDAGLFQKSACFVLKYSRSDTTFYMRT